MHIICRFALCLYSVQLSCVTERGEIMRTTHLLCEHAEKIAAAITLRKKHNQLVEQHVYMYTAFMHTHTHTHTLSLSLTLSHTHTE